MKNIRNTIVNTLESGNTYIEQYEDIEKILSKYIHDKEFLKSFRSSGDGISLAIHTKYLTKNKFTKNILVDFFNKLSNQKATCEYKKILNQEHTQIINFNNLQWSFPKIAETLNIEDIYSSAKIIFDAINNITEGIIKHLINVLFFIEKDKLNLNKKNYSFGDKISRLENIHPYLKVNKISLNQWRNMSDHKDYCVRDNKIIGHYADGKAIKYTIGSLISVLNRITLIANALYISFTLFLYSNRKLFKLNYQVREEIWLDNLKIGLSAQNFLIKEMCDNEIYSVALKDCVDHINKDNVKDRIAQSSQYAISFWPFVKKDIRIIYLNNKNETLASFLHKNIDFIDVINNNLPIEELAKRMTVEFISNSI